MDYYSLPKEIWKQILLQLRYKEVSNLCDISYEFNELCRDENIIEELKMRGFPRVSGYCESHDVHKFAGYHDDILPSLYDLLLSASYNFDIKEFDRLQNLVLDELYGTEVDLVRGDTIFLEDHYHKHNNGAYIFDGLNMIELDYKIKEDGFLPEEFTVINNNVPLNYWDYSELRYCGEFWFNHKLVKRQCIDNLNYITLNNTDYVFTTFNHNNSHYVITDYCKNEDVHLKLNNFKNLFNSNNTILLDSMMDNGIFYDEMTKLIPNSKIIRIKLNHWRNIVATF